MSLADAISASTPASTATSSTVRKTEQRPQGNSPAFLAYEAKRNACDAKINDIRSRIVIKDQMSSL